MAMAPELSRIALAPLEELLNRGIGRSSSAAGVAAILEGRNVDIRVEGLPVAFRVGISGGRARVRAPDPDSTADAGISGPPGALLRLLRDDPRTVFQSGSARITGDSTTAEHFSELLHLTRPDLEEELSRVIGDPAAHQIGNLARDVTAWGARAVDALSRSFGEFLTEERQVLPTRQEMQEFHADVDTLASDVDRAEARLKRLNT